MNAQEIKAMLPEGFPDDSRVWVYQSSRPFSEQQAGEINEQLHHFYAQWMVHGAPVKGWAGLFFNRFIVMMADESHLPVSGCSIDSATRIIKSLERQYEVQLFDRLSITFLIKGKPEVLPLSQVQYAIDQGFIDSETLLFNNLAATKKELAENWLQPVSKSWLKDQVVLPQ
jgi:hypothetical protein